MKNSEEWSDQGIEGEEGRESERVRDVYVLCSLKGNLKLILLFIACTCILQLSNILRNFSNTYTHTHIHVGTHTATRNRCVVHVDLFRCILYLPDIYSSVHILNTCKYICNLRFEVHVRVQYSKEYCVTHTHTHNSIVAYNLYSRSLHFVCCVCLFNLRHQCPIKLYINCLFLLK